MNFVYSILFWVDSIHNIGRPDCLIGLFEWLNYYERYNEWFIERETGSKWVTVEQTSSKCSRKRLIVSLLKTLLRLHLKEMINYFGFIHFKWKKFLTIVRKYRNKERVGQNRNRTENWCQRYAKITGRKLRTLFRCWSSNWKTRNPPRKRIGWRWTSFCRNWRTRNTIGKNRNV